MRTFVTTYYMLIFISYSRLWLLNRSSTFVIDGDFLRSVLFFPYSVCLRFSMIYKDFTHSPISCFVPRFNNLPSVITASVADGCNSFTVLPNPLPPDVAKSTIFLPLKSWASKNVLIIVGATYHHIGNPRRISS